MMQKKSVCGDGGWALFHGRWTLLEAIQIGSVTAGIALGYVWSCHLHRLFLLTETRWFASDNIILPLFKRRGRGSFTPCSEIFSYFVRLHIIHATTWGLGIQAVLFTQKLEAAPCPEALRVQLRPRDHG